MAGIYRLNEVVKIATTFTVNAVLTDPTTVTLAVTTPAGSATTYTYGTDAALVRDGLGSYYLNQTASSLGLWQYVWTGTGTAQSVKESYFTVAQGSSIPLVAGQDIGTIVRTLVNDSDSSNYEFSDTDLTNLLSRAVRFYERYKPYYLESTLTTVADQADYLAPSNAIRMVSVDWRPYPGISANTFVGFWNALYGSADILPMKDWRDDVLNKIRSELAIRYDSLGAGTSGQIQYPTSYANASYVRLYPTPTRSGDTVNIRFIAQHPLQSNDYFTIPFYHVQHLQDLLEAEVCDARALKIESTADVTRVGTTDIRFQNSAKALRLRSGLLRQRVVDALGVPVGTHG